VAGGWPPERLREEVARRSWFHTIDLGGGVLTPGRDDTITKARHMRLPADLSGRTVLDIGTYDGYFAFEAERRGAARVVATDRWAWEAPGSDARRNFELVHEVLGSRVEPREVAVEDLGPDTVGGPFDVVLFLGVLYHSPDPLGYLDRVRSVTGDLAIIETEVDLLDVDVPALAYYPGASYNEDPSNHFGPNRAAAEAMLRDAGFRRVEAFEPWTVRSDWAIQRDTTSLRNRLTRKVRTVRHRFRSGRMVFYAYA
jgi:tRNA (mo5U34)-methyltransferase